MLVFVEEKLQVKAEIEWCRAWNYTGYHCYSGRGMELSDLKIVRGELLSVDEATGFVYKFVVCSWKFPG